MTIDSNSLRPTPSDFAEFVYCGMSWVLSNSNNKDLDNIKRAKSQSYDKSEKHYALELGRRNEHKCIEKVLKDTQASNQQIVFNGTGENNHKFLSSEIAGISMHSKPDLIIENNNQLHLYEFKAVSNDVYLLMNPFNSVFAQIWCYTALKGIRINKFYLLRYYIDPLKNLTILTELTSSELDTSSFQRLFEQYNQAITLLKESKNAWDIGVIDKLKANMPKEKEDIYQKCSHCIFRTIGVCQLNQQVLDHRDFIS